jgi:hypothetical protein
MRSMRNAAEKCPVPNLSNARYTSGNSGSDLTISHSWQAQEA